jgi:hypothetical protein
MPELQKSCSLPEVNVLAASKNADSKTSFLQGVKF